MMSNDVVIISLKEKIDDLNQQAWESRVNDSQKAFELSQESVKLARSINYPKGLAEGLRSLGFGYVRLFKNDEAAPLLRESLSLFQSINDLKGQAVVYEYLGIIERNWGNLGLSLELLLKGNDLIRQLGSSDEIETTISYQIGVTYKHLGNHENALDYLYKALSIAKKTSFTLMEAYATNIIGSIYFDNGNFEQALELYQQGLVIRRQSNDKWGEAGSLDNIGITYLKLNQLDKAIDHCMQSLAICKDTGDKKGEANASLHLAEIYGQAGDSKQASKFSNESLEIRKARGDKRGEAEVLLFLADLHMNRKDADDEQIFGWISGALNLADEIKAQDLLSKAYYHLYQFYEQKGEYKRSLAQLEAHLKIEKEHHKNLINQKVSNLEITHKAETISQRNKELTELNERIAKANAELKVEASLERVRAVTMSMSKPDDILNICKVMFTELQALGFKEIRNALINFWDDDHGLLLDYDYSDFSGGNFARLSYSSHPVFEEFQKKVRQATDAFAELVISENELETWKQRRRDSDEYEDPRLENISALYYYFYSTGVGALGISTFSPISKQNLDVLKRFRNVFDLTYRRYLDIVKAEAQAREAQIQLALERVRARTMAMHHSDELTEVVKMLYQEFDKLKINNESTDLEIGLIDEETGIAKVWAHFYLSDGSISTFNFPFTHFEEINEEFKKWKGTPVEKRNELFFTTEFSKKQWQRFMNIAEELPELAEIFRPLVEAKIEKWVTHNAYFSHGMLTLQGTEAYSQETQEIQKRFAKVFEQTYTRFLDLKKAEAQAKEAQIEVALERIRARAMAMHSSNELIDVANILREQMALLEQPDLETSVINLLDEDSDNIHSWHAFREPELSSGRIIQGEAKFRKDSSELTKEMLAHYKSGKKEYTLEATGEKLNEFIQVLIKAEPEVLNYIAKDPPDKVYYHFATFTGGALLTVSYQPPNEDIRSLQRRAASVFDMAYRRYLDLKRAEAQTREAQIETGLERVRSKTMAMHKSEEVTGVAVSLNEELLKLGFEGGSTIIIIDKETGDTDQWTGFSEDKSIKSCYVPYFKHPYHDALLDSWKSGENFLVYTVKGDEKKPLDEHYFSTGYKIFPETDKKWMREMHSVTFSHAFMKYGAIHWGPGHLTEEQSRILQRFAKVFEQSYTRFLDLQKAEAQAREAQIEVAVERVRAKALAMHKSEDLHSVVVVLKRELMGLQIPDITAATIYLAQDDGSIRILDLSDTGGADGDKPQLKLDKVFRLEDTDPDLWIRRMWDHNENYFVLEADEKDFVRVVQFIRTIDPEGADLAENIIREKSIKKAWLPTVKLEKGIINIDLLAPPAREIENILLKMGAGFDLAYKRFLDLQKAEAQTREAQIEAALERVRSLTMAMHKSDELDETNLLIFRQIEALNIKLTGTGIHICQPDKPVSEAWMGDPLKGIMPKVLYEHTHDQLSEKMYEGWRDKETLRVEKVEGEKLKEHFNYVLPLLSDAKKYGDILPGSLYFHFAYFKYGFFVFVTAEECDKDHSIFIRFAKVFEQTYTRFLDLQKAEAQAREATIEVALERVRARALAMQQPEELKEVAQVLRTEMGLLGIEELETCSIYIHEKNSDSAECWYALKDIKEANRKMVTDHFHLNLNDTWVGREMKKFYNSDEKQTSVVMQGENRKEWIEYCYEQSPVFSGFYGEAIPDRTYHLYKFSHGYIGAAAPSEISVESWRLLSRAASVFSLAYSRFRDLSQARNDLIKLKEEKKRAEEALTELQNTQKQLIQTEKMASLGELTAGIAHEIQNPLNFVNNFSDVSNELIEEMKEELKAGNKEQALEIADNVKDNLEKILHHGKRADAIVKGMLQHSRSSSGVKEPTDINNLADEYLRLAFHGYRAKDKSFNAKFETNFDSSIEKINVIPQDIGRVILNLINNAFYTVNEKRKQVVNTRPGDPVGRGYEPMVIVATKKIDNRVEISVKDNGNGIPQKMLNKIFQPFFTTKPTGQGTGLGLSLSYDIITKGHAGEINVITNEGKGAEFIISLPVN